MSAERLTRPRHGTIADQMVEVLKASGVRRIYGLPGDSLNGLTDALRRDGEIAWEHVRHEEAAAFAAAGEAALTGELAVCAGSCGPGQPAPDQRPVRRATAAACRCWRSPRTSRARRSAAATSRRPIRRSCSASAASTASWSASPSSCPRLLRDRDAHGAVERRGVAVLVVPGEIFLAARRRRREPRPSGARPVDRAARRRGAGRRGRRAQRRRAGHDPGRRRLRGRPRRAGGARRARCKAPVVHALRGKEFVEYDNPYDVGMTGLLGFASGYRAMEHCDALLMLGTDFPYRAVLSRGRAGHPGRRARRAHRPPRAGRRRRWSARSRTRSTRCCRCSTARPTTRAPATA